MRVLALMVVLLPLVARAETPPVDTALRELAQAAPGEPRVQAAKALAGAPVPALVEALHARRSSSPDAVRAVLRAIHAEVPNAKGTFTTPPRPDKPEGPELDWLAALAKQPASPALEDALAVVALLRALADAHAEAAADAVLDFGFTPDGLVYRDECGRQIRRMVPESLPTLLRASQDRRRDAGAYARYANYQLDRLSMNRPSYAFAAATNDTVEIAMLHAVRDVKHPDAVSAVLDRVDAPSTGVRKAAREAWLGYVTGPEPPPAPKEFRKLPGGKKSKEKLPLYLTYRELADQELRRVLLQQTGHEAPKAATPEQMTKTLFDLYDQRRAEKGDAVLVEAAALAKAGKWDEVAAKYDALLRVDPLFAHRDQMVPGLLEAGRFFAARGERDKAVLAFDEALSLDPDGEHAAEARRELEAARAGGARPPAPTTQPSSAAADPPRPAWLLFAGLGAGAIGIAMLLVGLRRRAA
jgi:tetratricopeptide (TPR) repeat protein